MSTAARAVAAGLCPAGRRGARPHDYLVRGGGSHSLAVVFGSYFLSLPVHAGGAPVVDLHAIHSYVSFAGFGISRDHAR